jgi:ABC-type proline/glycine betaine transport system ATPase subunit
MITMLRMQATFAKLGRHIIVQGERDTDEALMCSNRLSICQHEELDQLITADRLINMPRAQFQAASSTHDACSKFCVRRMF